MYSEGEETEWSSSDSSGEDSTKVKIKINNHNDKSPVPHGLKPLEEAERKFNGFRSPQVRNRFGLSFISNSKFSADLILN